MAFDFNLLKEKRKFVSFVRAMEKASFEIIAPLGTLGRAVICLYFNDISSWLFNSF